MNHRDDNQDDAALVALVLAGDRELFGPLLLRYYASVVRLCRRLLGSTPEAQDVAQEAALQAFLGLTSLQEPARFGAWLHAIAANLARMLLRRRHVLSLDMPSGGAPIVLWAAGPHTPEEIHIAREIHDTIVAALNELSVVNREVVIGFYLAGYSYVELAELLGVPVSTVKGRLFKGRRQLRRRLAPLAHEILKPDRRPRKERLMEASDLVEVRIESIRSSPLTLHRVLVLGEQGGDRQLPIWIGPSEAEAIQLALDGQQPQRPMTHDLVLRLIAPMGAQIQRVVVNRIAENTFYAEISLIVGDQIHQIDARPSDAIAVAVRTGAQILVAHSVFETAGTRLLDERLKQDEQELATLYPAPPAGEQTWVLQFEARTEPTHSKHFPVLYFKSTDWPGTPYIRDIEWEGQERMAVRLPGADENAAWLIVDPTLWEKLVETVWRFTQRPATMQAAEGAESAAEGSGDEP